MGGKTEKTVKKVIKGRGKGIGGGGFTWGRGWRGRRARRGCGLRGAAWGGGWRGGPRGVFGWSAEKKRGFGVVEGERGGNRKVLGSKLGDLGRTLEGVV